MLIDVAQMAAQCAHHRQEVWQMELRKELARVIETKQRELKTHEAAKEQAEHMITVIQEGLPALEAALAVLQNGFMGVGADEPEEVWVPTNPYPSTVLGHAVFEVLARAGHQLHTSEIRQHLESRLGHAVKPASVEHVVYRDISVFKKVAPGVFTLRSAEESRG